MSNCSHCQSPLTSGGKFCSICGKAQASEVETCFQCGAPARPTDAFCTNCGERNDVPCPGCGIGVERLAKVCPDCGFNIEEGKSLGHVKEDRQRAKEVLELIDSPVSLSQFKQKYPYLTQGDMDADYVRIIEQALSLGKSQPIVNLQLASYPRQWAIQKVGIFRRLLTLMIDAPVLLALVLGGLVLFIGKADEPGMLGLTGDARGFFALGWLFFCYFAYCVGTEFIFGATLGGLVCGVRVVNRFGRRQSVMTLVKRNAIKLLPFIGPYTMAPYVKPDHEVVKS
jgi:predicted amidophosphoribosyltransferase